MKVRDQRGRQGFSLLEIIIALFLVCLMFGMAIMATRQFLGMKSCEAPPVRWL
ncbi:MAG: prepilin-type N-terminal cleavage/methylation domain-containing protein [Blastochloris sp.]|nr:prepilin-type N-terminal cleavage/methylation domain-containing protein [Blastochloris sp.]